MTVLVSRPSQTYAPGTRSFDFTAGAAAQNYRITLTRESWPNGGTLSYGLVWNGNIGGGSVTGQSTGPIIGRSGAEMTTLTMEARKPAGITDGRVTITNSVALTSAITVESV
jgi:hypothetical protein